MTSPLPRAHPPTPPDSLLNLHDLLDQAGGQAACQQDIGASGYPSCLRSKVQAILSFDQVTWLSPFLKNFVLCKLRRNFKISMYSALHASIMYCILMYVHMPVVRSANYCTYTRSNPNNSSFSMHVHKIDLSIQDNEAYKKMIAIFLFPLP